MSVRPTFVGYVPETHDALLLFQAVLDGILEPVPRRPHDQERREVIFSGAVFVFMENRSSIKRWTDHITWSPSRILGNFLLYRQLERPSTAGERKISKRTRQRQRQRSRGESFSIGEDDLESPSSPHGGLSRDEGIDHYEPPSPSDDCEGMSFKGQGRPYNPEWSLYGSLIKDNPQKFAYTPHGLVKKTFSLQFGKDHIHLVSYYRAKDVRSGRLTTPGMNPRLAALQVNSELIRNSGNFRVPLTHIHVVPQLDGPGPRLDQYTHEYGLPGYGDDGVLSAHPYWSLQGQNVSRGSAPIGASPSYSNYGNSWSNGPVPSQRDMFYNNVHSQAPSTNRVMSVPSNSNAITNNDSNNSSYSAYQAPNWINAVGGTGSSHNSGSYGPPDPQNYATQSVYTSSLKRSRYPGDLGGTLDEPEPF